MGYSLSTHEIIYLRDTYIYGDTVSYTPPFFLPYSAASTGGFRDFVSEEAGIVDFLVVFDGFFCSRTSWAGELGEHALEP